MRYHPQEAFVALTDRAWFDFLSARSDDGTIDEVNFWQPRATTPMKKMLPGEPIFFRLKKPDYAIVGYGFYAHFHLLDLDLAWQTFGEKNGDPTRERFFERIGEYRGIDLLQPTARRDPIGCTVLRDAVFWPASRWIPWGVSRGWPPNIVQGRTEREPNNLALLMEAIRVDDAQPPPDLAADNFQLLAADDRTWSVRGKPCARGRGRSVCGCFRRTGNARSPASTRISCSTARTFSRTWGLAAITLRTASYSRRNSTRCSMLAT